MKTEGATERAERLRGELFQQLGYVVGKHDPMVALAYTLRQVHEDQHDALVQGLQAIEAKTLELTARGREHIRDYARALSRELGDGLRAQLDAAAIGEQVVEACAETLARQVSTAIRGHLETQDDRLQELVHTVMQKHDEQVLWNVHHKLSVHTKQHTRNTLTIVVIVACMMAVSTAVLLRGSALQRQADALFAAAQTPAAFECTQIAGPKAVPLNLGRRHGQRK